VDAALRPCVVIPTYDNPRTIAEVVRRARVHVPDVIVVDDGSAAENRAAVETLAAEGLVVAVRRETNGGKGAAVLDGLHEALRRGFTHAIQIDADLQHDTDDLPKLLQAARESPEALVLAAPRFDDTAPKARVIGRRITVFWTDIEAGRGVIEDPMCGFRVYPLATATTTRVVGRRMDFDIEIAVRMVWAGVPVVNLPTRVRYVPAAQGGVSHFAMFGDNMRISWMHTRLMHVVIFWRLPMRALRWIRRRFGGE
jgi:glycosyltransferase involved in cell wall biosynthesis